MQLYRLQLKSPFSFLPAHHVLNPKTRSHAEAQSICVHRSPSVATLLPFLQTCHSRREVLSERGSSHLIEIRRCWRYVPFMARRRRSAAGGVIYHVLNRGNCRMDLFEKEGDFAAFIKLLEEGRQRTNMRILGYCLMSNHWHLVLWPRHESDLSRFVQWVSTTHVRRWRNHRGNDGEGHLYQGRFKSFPIQDDRHLLTALRYVEANPLRARMVSRAAAWGWSSLGGAAGADGVRVSLSPSPAPKPKNWVEIVNEKLPPQTLEQLKTCIVRGQPFGQAEWVKKIAAKLGLQSSLRNPWRPSKLPAAPKRRGPAKSS